MLACLSRMQRMPGRNVTSASASRLISLHAFLADHWTRVLVDNECSLLLVSSNLLLHWTRDGVSPVSDRLDLTRLWEREKERERTEQQQQNRCVSRDAMSLPVTR